MNDDPQVELEQLGLLPAEAQVYLALIHNGPLGASAIASVISIPRSSVYPTLNSLVDKGLVEAGAGYGSRFTAVLPQQAIPALIRREKEELSAREHLGKQLSERLSSLAEPIEKGPEELIQVIRSPRGVTERFDRLQLEAERQIEVFTKAPLFNYEGNPAQEKAMRRGVRVRSLYERAVLDVPGVKPYLAKWIAGGEEARVYEGELPHKLAIFDRQSVLVLLTMPCDQMRTLYIRHPELALSLGMLFDFLWERAKPINAALDEKRISAERNRLKPNKRTRPLRGHDATPTNRRAIKGGRDGNHRRTQKQSRPLAR